MLMMAIIICLCLSGVMVLFLKLTRNSKKRKRWLITVLILPVLLLLSVKIVKGFIPFPLGLRHIVYQIFDLQDLHQPIIIDDFKFYEKGFTKTYPLEAKYLDNYSIGFLSTKKNLSTKDKFSGKIKAEFFWKEKLLFEEIGTTQYLASYSDNTMNYYQSALLLDFGIPLQKKYKENISVKLTVLLPANELRKYGDSIKLFIAVKPM